METSLFSGEPAARPLPLWRRVLAQFHSLHRLQTLKSRLAIGSLLALSVGMAVTAWDMSEVAEAEILHRAQQREHIDAQQIAGLIGHRVAELQRALTLAAEHLNPALVADHDRLLAHLSNQPLLRAMFASLSVSDAQGQMKVLLTPEGESQALVNLADRDYFQRTVRTGRPQISEPIQSRSNGEPVVIFTQPLHRAVLGPGGAQVQGELRGVLFGSLRLANRDLIGFLAESRDYDDRSQIVIADDAGRILAHPQQASLLQPVSLDARLAQAAAKWQQAGRPLIGTAEAWSGDGDVVAMAGEPITGWHVWRVASREELLTPLRLARANALKVASVVGTLLSAALGVFIAWQLGPLRKLELRAADLLQGNDIGEWPSASGEIGQLTQTLRHVWAERTQAESFNAQVLQKLNSVMSASPVGLAFVRSQRFELFSAEGCRMLGYAEAELVGQPAALIFPARDDQSALEEQARVAFEAGRSYEGEWRLLDAAGNTFWAHIRARPVVPGDLASGSIWSLYNIEEQVASRQDVEHAALHDPLTGVLNRKGFALKLTAAFFAIRSEPGSCLVMLDLDHFKPVNDQGGHAAGDAMLKAIAALIVSMVRNTDAVARLGGDEFAVLLANCDEPRALTVAEKVRQSISELSVTWEGQTFQVGASIGLAGLHSDCHGVDQWLAAADTACYDAKHAGRNAVRAASSPQQQPVAGGRVPRLQFLGPFTRGAGSQVRRVDPDSDGSTVANCAP